MNSTSKGRKVKKKYIQNYGYICKKIGKVDSKCISVPLNDIKHIEPLPKRCKR